MNYQLTEPGSHTDHAEVTLSFPCSAEFVSIARLAILGIASRMSLSYDEVEDVRLAVGEACSHAVDRSEAAIGRTPSSGGRGTIRITSQITPNVLTIDVADDIPPTSLTAPVSVPNNDASVIDKQGLGALLMEILVDEVKISVDPTGTNVRLVKRSRAV